MVIQEHNYIININYNIIKYIISKGYTNKLKNFIEKVLKAVQYK